MRTHSRYEALRASRVVLTRMAPLVRFGLFSVGVSLFLDQTRTLISDAQFTWGERRVMGLVALITLGGFGLAGWVAGRLLRTAAELIDALIDGVESAGRTAELIEVHLVPALNRVAAALQRNGPVPATVAPPSLRPPTGAASSAEEARRAIAAGRWGEAERLVAAFARTFPQAADRERLGDELRAARQAAVADLRAQLDEARQSGDADAVIDARDALTEHLRGGPLEDLDREVVAWIYAQIQARVRAGTIDGGVAALATRAADSLGDTPEGARLRAAVPRFWREAGLCPRCLRPYRGPAEACPRCQAQAQAAAARPENPSEALP